MLSTSEAGSGHPTSCFSAADLTTVLFDKHFTYDLSNPKNIANDRFIISKGHVAPLYYALFSLAGGLKRKELLTLRKFKSRLEGHPTPRFKYADVSTGSLGQGLSIGAGMVLALRAKTQNLRLKTQNLPKVFVLLGDGELAEGQIYEAANFAAANRLSNLIAIADINGLGQTGKTAYFHDTGHYKNVFSALGFVTKVIDGHSFDEIKKAFEEAVSNTSGKPFIIIAKTIKGKGVSLVEGREDFHGKAIPKVEIEKALSELGLSKEVALKDKVLFRLQKPKSEENSAGFERLNLREGLNLKYKKGEEYATREVFGEVLAEIGEANNNVYVIDGDVGNSTFTEKFKKVGSQRFIQCYIAEQNMVGVAAGLSALGKKAVACTFGAFLTRALDQIRMARISSSNITFVGSHCGISIGEDGPSQMALEDIAMFSAIADSVILHPSDAVATAKLVPQAIDYKGISYLRTLRPKTPTIYKEDEEFKIGGSKILRHAKNDVLTIVATGITVHEALKAYDALKKENISIRVVDCYSIKPLDTKGIEKCIKETEKAILITVEDHYYNGGLGDMIAAEVGGKAKIVKLAVKSIPFSGDKNSLLREFGIDAEAIVKTVKDIV